ncbi:septum formation inhibitor Maf [Microbulbifer flavimaris]|uniref:7-methyl-GTP pyrophosphatase n=1 Tax=Microbulbifer flavimaris TaxID=1781068 RepID=A0ABX4I3L8_9GAMM|nr:MULTISPECIES: nucleoside triphosphate pyrophosphatase [Microbulbifer]KUJ84686.1 septum formation inhibitor Maf [Microbulbifer sp. ZGT114]PCO06778.1 septum formation inhibitor Maf [Microbulbifer flavimaris]
MPRSMILASSSPYRRQLLEQLGLPFQCAAPHIKEEALPGEGAEALARRLAAEKATALGARFPDALIIGSDQVAELDGRPQGKPGNLENAIRQLQACSGRKVNFHTGISVLDTTSGRQHTEVEKFTVYFRDLPEQQILNYLEREQPFDCAGSFKVEGLGIALFEKMEGSDYNSLIGLPLIRLVTLLTEFGLNPLDTH